MTAPRRREVRLNSTSRTRICPQCGAVMPITPAMDVEVNTNSAAAAASAAGAAAGSRPLAEGRRRALWESLSISVAALGVVAAGILGLALSSLQTIKVNYAHYLTGLAQTAASLVDPALQESIRLPSEINGPDYRRAVAPLRRMRESVPDIHYIYTVVRQGGAVRFVLDAADPKINARDGLDDQSGVGQIYTGEDSAMLRALGDGVRPGVAAATARPLTDQWGTFMTGWAPLVDRHGRPIGAVGVDVNATFYLARLAAARDWAMIGIAPAILLIVVLGVAFHRNRLRGLAAAQVLADERQRLRAIIEGTDVGTWERDVSAGLFRVSDRWAAMIGRRASDLEPLTDARWRALLHPQDAAALDRFCSDGDGGPEAVCEHEFRMLHADGRWVWVLTRGKVMEWDAAGRPMRMAGIQMDISTLKSVELSLKESESKFRSLFELSPIGIALNDGHTGRFLQVNDAMLGASGYSREEWLAMSYRDITPPRYAAQEREQLEQLSTTGRYGPYEKEYLRKDGRSYAVLLSGIRMHDASGRAVIWSIVQDISQRKAMESALLDAARRDKLTGLANRAQFMTTLEHALARVKDGSQPPFAVMFLDFDRFKMINDTLGHKAGDELLRQIADRLRSALRNNDSIGIHHAGNLVSRFGGDEFLILLNDLQTSADAVVIAERLLNVLAPLYNIFGRDVHSTASIGIVTSDQCREGAEEIVRNADVAMYEAKRAGRGCSVVFNEAMHRRLSRHVSIETGLRRAIGTSELSVVYQPIVELESGRTVSAEALVRWNHPVLGAVSPSEFIPIAEESDLIVALGHWVLREACEALVEWRRADPERAPKTVSVNISQAELALGPSLLAHLGATLASVGLPAECLQLEVTEREVMRDPKASLALMGELRTLGVRLAMDDFGTGTSSLAFLRDYPFDTIKIDRSFVRDLNTNPDVLAVIHATVNLVENLGMASLAEGVEEASQVAVLQSLGCRYAQGYLFSRPVSAGRLLDSCGISRV